MTVSIKKLFLTTILISATFAMAASKPIEILVGESKVYKYKDARSIIVQDNGAVRYENLEYNVVKIIGKKIGTAYINLLDYDNNVQTIKVTVKYKSESSFSKIIRAKNRYHGTNVLYMKSDPENNEYVNQRMLVNKLFFTTKVNERIISTRINYKSYATGENDSDNAIETLSLKIDSPGNSTIIGDSQVNYSQTTVPYLNIQGIRTMGYSRLIPAIPVRYDIFAGKSVGTYWGKLLEFKADFEDATLTGGSLTTYLLENNKLALGYIFAQKNQEDSEGQQQTSARISSVQAKYALDEKMFIAGEFSQDMEEEKSSIYDLKYQNKAKKLNLNLKFTNTDAAYTPVSDWDPVQLGKRGVAVYGSLRQKLFSMRAYFDKYSRLYPDSVLNEDTLFENSKLFINFLKVSFTKPMLYIYNSLGTNHSRNGYTLYLNDIDLKYVTFYLKYNPYYYQNIGDATGYSIRRETTTYGIQRGFGFVELSLEKFDTMENQEVDNAYHGYNFNTSTPWLDIIPWFQSQSRFSYRYQTRVDSNGTLNDNISIYRAELRDSITTDLSWSLRLKYTYSHSLSYVWQQEAYLYPEEDITQASIEGSLSLRF